MIIEPEFDKETFFEAGNQEDFSKLLRACAYALEKKMSLYNAIEETKVKFQIIMCSIVKNEAVNDEGKIEETEAEFCENYQLQDFIEDIPYGVRLAFLGAECTANLIRCVSISENEESRILYEHIKKSLEEENV
ncbi:MAG: hypothetical protein KME49_14360 [Brasilonema octagenarum HA4186-MV1]|jgi:hypothetical protein|uniref:Uncharacterized protein n=1 Tax=Brasilonema sennae CENA114 TaxID=415709 RepID=A0A856MEL9_9CYAN|nr:hypothetical protein [Brasilonema sennae]MBW4626643.1 hypothetical protein [Brasilonema octagenarum HA4186-MV1]QDL09775.1 hypothetical protein DP114_19410 [Brasilonema sennae CENA114]QDL16128.1 hypothetical protein DP113_19335 [Brasilonema octagenarum UFV-E1]